MAEQALCESDTLRALDHRVRNNYAALLSLVDLTRVGTTSVADFASAMTGHISAIATSHDLLSRTQFRTLHLNELVAALGQASERESVSVQGPDVHVASRQSVALSLILKQLFVATPRDARLSFQWTWIDQNARTLQITSNVADNAVIRLTPSMQSLIEGLVRSEMRGEMRGSESGAEVTLRVTLDP
jgi:hypothetical protein